MLRADQDVGTGARAGGEALRGHMPALDGIRGLAILLVMGHHFFSAISVDSRVGSSVVHLLQAGWMGVDLFFVLSGFLITGILFDAKGSQGFFRNFYTRRALRIFPLYFVLLALTLLLGPWVMPAGDAGNIELRQNFPWLFCYMTNYVMNATHSFHAFEGPRIDFSHFWSLAVEEHFYLVWPCIVAFLPRRSILRVCGGLIVLSLVAKAAIAWTHPTNLIGIYTLTQCRMDSLLIGAAVALVARSPEGLAPFLGPARLIVKLGIPLVVAAILVRGELPRAVSLTGILIYPALAILAAALLSCTLTTTGPLNRFFSGGFMRFLGAYSYGLYIFHGCLKNVFTTWNDAGCFRFAGDSPWVANGVFIGAWFGASLLCALVSRAVLEGPFLRLKARFGAGAKSAVSTV